MKHDESRSRSFAIGPLAVLAVLAIGGCGEERSGDGRPSRAECEAARAHEATLVVALAASPDDDERARAELAKHQANLAEVGGAEAIDRCVATETRAHLACVTKAATRAELEGCGGSTAP